MFLLRRGAVLMRAKRSVSTVKSYAESDNDEFDEKEDEFEDEDEEEQEKEKKPTKKKSKSSTKSLPPSLEDSDKWKITSGERVRSSSTGALRLNPSLTTVPFLPVHEREADFDKIVSWNVNGLRSVMSKSSIERWIAEEKPLIICLQETKTNSAKKDGIPDMSKIAPAFKPYWAHAEKAGYAGVCTLQRKTLIEPISVKYGIGSEKYDKEGRTVTLEFQNVFVVNSYFPNSGDKLVKLAKRREWNKEFDAFLQTLKHKSVLLLGDLNVAPHPVDLHNPKGNLMSAGFSKEEREDFHALLKSADLVDSYRHLHPVADLNVSLGTKGDGYTYWGFRHNARETNKGWRVDHVLVSQALIGSVETSFVRRELLGSDHTVVGVLLNKMVLETKKD